MHRLRLRLARELTATPRRVPALGAGHRRAPDVFVRRSRFDDNGEPSDAPGMPPLARSATSMSYRLAAATSLQDYRSRAQTVRADH
jgi:hypothetical protein